MARRIKLFLILIFAFISSFAGDTITVTKNSVKVYQYISPAAVHDTVYVAVHDTVKIPCDTVKPVQKDTIWRGLYINGTNSIAGNKTKEDALVSDLKRWKFNSIHLYSIDGSNDAALTSLFIRIRKETFVTDITATASSGTTFTGTRTTWNRNHVDSADYDGWNLEYEPWNATDVTSAWASNIQYLVQMKSGIPSTVDRIADYFGWWTKAPMTTQTPDTLVKYLSYLLVHDYRTAPDFAYMKGRCDDLNNAAKKRGVILLLRAIFSAEPTFMQDYLKTHTLDQAYAVLLAAFNAVGYTNIKLDGYLVFHLDFLRVSQPAPSTARSANVFAPDFINETTKSHLKTANPAN